MKNLLMLAGIAAVLGAGTACFGLFSSAKDRPGVSDSCDDLTGQAKVDCERRRER
jgi:hypothetical protein